MMATIRMANSQPYSNAQWLWPPDISAGWIYSPQVLLMPASTSTIFHNTAETTLTDGWEDLTWRRQDQEDGQKEPRMAVVPKVEQIEKNEEPLGWTAQYPVQDLRAEGQTCPNLPYTAGPSHDIPSSPFGPPSYPLPNTLHIGMPTTSQDLTGTEKMDHKIEEINGVPLSFTTKSTCLISDTSKGHRVAEGEQAIRAKRDRPKSDPVTQSTVGKVSKKTKRAKGRPKHCRRREIVACPKEGCSKTYGRRADVARHIRSVCLLEHVERDC